MSYLRHSPEQELNTKYSELSKYVAKRAQAKHRKLNTALHQLNQRRIDEIILNTLGTPIIFRSRMSYDHPYRKLADLFLDTVQSIEAESIKLQF